MAEIKKQKVFVGMSGGVDSSVAALLLKNQGYEVFGCFIKGWYPEGMACGWKNDRRDAMRVCAKLGIPFLTTDAEKEYKREVVDYMIREYKAGRTPNPDVMCNRHIKFGIFLKKALKMGADFIATGHYVQLSRKFPISNFQFLNNDKISKLKNSDIENCLKIKNLKLKIATDKNKDQSYFLWTLTQGQLQHCLFPLGGLTKPEVREIARKNGLETAEKPDSQGVCFIGEFKMEDFLKKYIKPKKGDVFAVDGGKTCPTEQSQSFRRVGEHDGIQFYTVGQRHGFNFAGGVPYYIVEKDIKKNILVVAPGNHEKDFYKKEVEILGVNWLSGIIPSLGKNYKVRIRYRQPLQGCRVNSIHQASSGKVKKKTQLPNTKYKIRFTAPQRAVTPGQSLVIYDTKGVMLGGGIIQ